MKLNAIRLNNILGRYESFKKESKIFFYYFQIPMALLCVLYGIAATVGKFKTGHFPPLFTTGLRMILAGIVLLGYQFYFHREGFTLKKKHIFSIIAISVTGVYLANFLGIWASKFMDPKKFYFLVSFCPIATAIISYLWLSENISSRKWLGLIIGIMGYLPILISSSDNESGIGSILFLSYAEIAVLLASLVSAFGWVLVRQLLKQKDIYPTMVNAISMLIGSIIILGQSFIQETWDPFPISDFYVFLPWFSMLMLVSNLITQNLHAVLLRSYSATYLSFAMLMQPFFMAVFEWLLAGEIASFYLWISMLITCAGLYIFYKEEIKH